MASWRVLIDEDALKFLENLPEKSLRIAKEKLRILEEDPFPGKHGDKELIQRKGHKDTYRLHISRSYTAFYRVYKDERIVKVLHITTIEQAYKLYGR
jgi:mRNA interferase RelE/StbE